MKWSRKVKKPVVRREEQMMQIQRNLIFDIGLHKGLDARYYLSKGFRVVGLEAVPALCEQAATLNAGSLKEGKLVIVQRALFHEGSTSVDFYVNPQKDDWGSLSRAAAEQNAATALNIKVPTITLNDLLETHGIPYYIKCDIEGGDAIFVEQLLRSGSRPAFVSIELTHLEDLASLYQAGYRRFQLVNQWLHFFTSTPNPSLEGKTLTEVRFNSEMSGLFGLDLPKKWVEFNEAARRFIAWSDLRQMDDSLGIGWLDVHATTEETLDKQDYWAPQSV